VDGDHRRKSALEAWSAVDRSSISVFAVAHADEPIKIGILLIRYPAPAISINHDVHGANVAVDLFNKKGGGWGRRRPF
jgi:hypothetical protein